MGKKFGALPKSKNFGRIRQALYRGGLLIQWNLYIVVTLETQPVGCYTEVVCLYSPWDTTSWLLYRGGLFIQSLGHNQLAVIQRWSVYTVLGTQPVGCYTEVVCLYSGTCI